MPRELTSEELHRLELDDVVLRGEVLVACPALAGKHQFNLMPPDREHPNALRVYWYAFGVGDDLGALSREEKSALQKEWKEKPLPSLPDQMTIRWKHLDGVAVELVHLKGFIGHTLPTDPMALLGQRR